MANRPASSLPPPAFEFGRRIGCQLRATVLRGLAASGARLHMRGQATSARGSDMTTFDDRENAFEAKFAHDADLKFRAEARRNKLLGLWAAGLMGKQGEDASAYAMAVIESDFAEAGDEDVYRKLSGDLGNLSDEATIRARMAELAIAAKRQLMSEG